MVLIVLFVIIFFGTPRWEHLDDTASQREAIANMAKILNQEEATISNVAVTNALKVGDKDVMAEIQAAKDAAKRAHDAANSARQHADNKAQWAYNHATNMRSPCNWHGERKVHGDHGCNDDIIINCQGGRVVGMRFKC